VAEGVELAEQADQLRHLACDELQGYYFSRPLAAQALIKWLQNQQESPEQRRHVNLSEQILI